MLHARASRKGICRRYSGEIILPEWKESTSLMPLRYATVTGLPMYLLAKRNVACPGAMSEPINQHSKASKSGLWTQNPSG